MCSNCGTINLNLTLNDRIWTCSICNTEHDRDINAAINIKNIGLKTGMEYPVVSVEKKKTKSVKIKKSTLMKQKVILPAVSV